ncbi:hypothetical protein AURDEDRAFT_178364 [Auricularia subglabra TFB-10046 SS5]|uniref:DUF8191 domain-containing protein n=1 Tax=Auricularia subglabra (strain TFB-10046 / SS5) TaxID=717982 RepID=J0WJU2_AURST|nr:hypothetical protein AURDEDRAFT_178364 [Auricularia subglabra TFB-10046 SS5]
MPDSDDELPEPIWDANDGCFRCAACVGEVVDGECQFCNTLHLEPETTAEQDLHTTDDWTFAPLSSDRLPTERSETPLAPGFDDVVTPTTFSGGDSAYRTLLRRGATPEMIDEFRLEWNQTSGIVALATEELYETWAGPAIRRGDLWKIALGRRLTLEEYDIDGYDFVTELLEDCLHPAGLTVMYWETVQERRGVWMTRPKRLRQDEQDAPPLPTLSLDGPIAYRDEYESDSGTDDGDTDQAVDWYEAIRSGIAGDTESTRISDGEDFVPMVDEDGGNYSTTLMSDEDEEGDAMDCDSASPATDSDEPGSGWDSQEELSGDEEAM